MQLKKSVFTRMRNRLGRRFVAPVPVALALVLLVVAAGQAVGPILSGGVTGTAGLVVSQAITLDVDHDLGSNPVVGGASDAVTTRNDEGTSFTAAVELTIGQPVAICVMLENSSERDASASLVIDAPAGVDIEVEEFSGSAAEECYVDEDEWLGQLGDNQYLDEGQLSRRTWTLIVEKEAGNPGASFDGLRLLIEPTDTIKPGFYTIAGRIIQTGG